MAERFVVIMAGGRGERFWPVSRLARPKHLLPIVGEKPMLAQTIERLGDLVPPERVLIITNAEQREATRETVPSLPPENVIAEPVGRDTAPAVALATMLVGARDPEAAFALLPADAVIHDAESFRQVLGAAFAAAEQEKVFVTIGIQPDHPATGFGYIKQGAKTFAAEGRDVFAVEAFREKPDLATAEQYLADGGYFWNAGMFLWRVPVIEEAFREHAPAIWQGLAPVAENLRLGTDFTDSLASVYPELEKISVDFAIMEKISGVVMLESAFDWDDVGSWPAVERHYPTDDSGNTVRGKAVLEGASGNIVYATGETAVALLGVKDLIVVQTGDAVLVMPKDRAQDIKAVVKQAQADDDLKQLC